MNGRRTIAIGILAGGITLIPAAAFAYIAPSPDSGTIPPSPASTPSETTSTPTETTPPKTGTVVVENARTTGEGTTTTTTEAELLSSTGFAGTTMALGAGVLLVAGATTVIVAARRGDPEDAQ